MDWHSRESPYPELARGTRGISVENVATDCGGSAISLRELMPFSGRRHIGQTADFAVHADVPSAAKQTIINRSPNSSRLFSYAWATLRAGE
jgi:hypothetical protein